MFYLLVRSIPALEVRVYEFGKFLPRATKYVFFFPRTIILYWEMDERRRIQAFIDDWLTFNVDILQKDHNTDTEQSDISDEENSEQTEYNFVDNAIPNDDNYHESDDELPLSIRILPHYVGKDGTRWNKRAPNQRVRTSKIGCFTNY